MNDLDSRLAACNPVRFEDLGDAAASAEAAELLQRVLSQPIARPARRHPFRPGWPSRAWLAAAAAVIVAVAVTLAMQWPTGQHARLPRKMTPGVQLIDFSAKGGNVIALITHPDAAARQLTAVFRAHGLHIDLRTVPVSPSLVGTFVYTDTPSLRTMWKRNCSVTGCPVGLVIPASFTGHASVVVGRTARRGEIYESTADAFAPGEVLHCSGLLGVAASAALPVLKKLRLSAHWWTLTDSNWPLSSPGSTPRPGQHKERRPTGYIVEADPTCATTVNLDTLPILPRNHQFRKLTSQWNRGCH
jgi:hypothetical protein